MDDHWTSQQSGGGGRSKRCLVLTLAVVLSLAPVGLSFFLTLETALGYDNLLGNGGFEQGTSAWTASYGATFITVTEPVSAGNWAAALNRSDTTGEIYIQQEVDIVPGATYTLTGRIYKDEPDFQRACLCIEWVESGSPDLQECLSDDDDFYFPITVGPTVAPSDATRAKIKAMAEVRTANPSIPVYFDELALTSSMMPKGFFPLSLKNYPR